MKHEESKTPPKRPRLLYETSNNNCIPPVPVTVEKQKDHDDNDEEIQVLEARPSSSGSNSVPMIETNNKTTTEEEEEDVVVESSTLVNPNIVYSHARFHCGVHPFSMDPFKFCEKCFCSTCNVKASECTNWNHHCHVVSSSKPPKTKAQQQDDESEEEEDDLFQDDNDEEEYNDMMEGDSIFADFQRRIGAMRRGRFRNQGRRGYYNSEGGQSSTRRPGRILETFATKLKDQIALIDHGPNNKYNAAKPHCESETKKVQGDIPQLGLQPSFFVQGVRIGWPFPVILPPQRQMAIHLIKALQNRMHVVLESPTGTGKSAAILCSVLAWQRHFVKTNNNNNNNKSGKTNQMQMMLPSPNEEDNNDKDDETQKVPRIYYCSRTHTQVAQIVASLKKTPYRPRMSVLGSRDRLCIHKEIINRDASGEARKRKGVNVNRACQTRVRNTEKARRALLNAYDYDYQDDNPPVALPGDGHGGGGGEQGAGSTPDNDELEEDDDDPSGSATAQWITSRTTKRLTCPHYRQLTTKRNARRATSRFVLDPTTINCCTAGGEQTKLGVHDIEDLVDFGVNPYVKKGVAIYRPTGQGRFQMEIGHDNASNTTHVHKFATQEAALRAAEVQEKHDQITRVNGNNVRNKTLIQVTDEMSNTPRDPLVLDLYDFVDCPPGEHAPEQHDSNTETSSLYSSHSSCPYYLSRELSKYAEIVFAPYNYILDPHIRKSLEIDLQDSVVILDEAHNVEDTLKEAGSGKFGEIELCEILAMLSRHAQAMASYDEVSVDGVEVPLSDVAHELLLFIERLLQYVQSQRESFETSPGRTGATAAIDEYRKFGGTIPDDQEYEVKYDGPNGHGVMGKAVGCKPFFDRIAGSKDTMEKLQKYASALESKLANRGRDEQHHSPAESGSTLMDRLLEIVTKFFFAMKATEHYYVSCIVQANGNLEHASGGEEEQGHNRRSRFKKNPKSLPFISPRSPLAPNEPLPVCMHEVCRRKGPNVLGQGVKHGSQCNGSRPRWEGHLVLKLLWPGQLMNDIASQCRTVVLASGTLAPIPSLCGELHLNPPREPLHATITVSQSPNNLLRNDSPSAVGGRLQIHPKPLEAKHVINLPKQLFAVSIGQFPDGSPLTVTYSNYKNKEFFPKLGDAIATVVEAIPRGGVLVFFPSYSFLKKCVKCWNPTTDTHQRRHYWGDRLGNDYNAPHVWARFVNSKGTVIEEPTGNQEKFEEAKAEYEEAIKRDGKCMLLAVYRGKMSEGISFNDDNARGVICVGVPFPSSFDRAIKAKMSYNEEQRKLRGNENLLPAREWYSQQAYRALAQALGRCIRHQADYGTVVLMDSRHCNDGAPIDGTVCRAHANLPKWMRGHVRTLCMGFKHFGQNASDYVNGGYRGLSNEMRTFFAEAPAFSQGVISENKKSYEEAQKRNTAALSRLGADEKTIKQ